MEEHTLNMKTETTMTATFADKAEAVQFVAKALEGAKVIRVWFSDHFWNPADAERYEVQVVTSDQAQNVCTYTGEISANQGT